VLDPSSIPFIYAPIQRHSKAVLRRGPMASILGSLLRLTIQASIPSSHQTDLRLPSKRQSAAPGAFCALVDFVATIRAIRSPGLSIPFLISVIANVMLPKLYAMAAMWALNSRDEIRSAKAVIEPSTHLDLPSSRGVSAGSTSAPKMSRYLSAGGMDTTGSQSTSSISRSGNIRPNSGERKAWEV
jgi:hypothetical protein